MDFVSKPSNRLFLDLEGKTFSRLLVLGFLGRDRNHSWWHCRCICGRVVRTSANKLRTGSTKSCGCYKRDVTRDRSSARADRFGRSSNGELTVERLKHVLTLDEQTGVFSHRLSRGNVKAGEPAGLLSGDGYWVVTIDARHYLAHRLIWFWKTGMWPPEIDHKNLARGDNCDTNLRTADRTSNNGNHPCRRDSLTGLKGVTRVGKSSRFFARARKGGVVHYLGVFDTAEEANQAYFSKAKELFGDFARRE